MDASQWRNIKQHVLPYGSSRPLTRKLSFDVSSSESRSTEASTSMATENTSVTINVAKLAEVSQITALLVNIPATRKEVNYSFFMTGHGVWKATNGGIIHFGRTNN
jgi:hypothetical protein